MIEHLMKTHFSILSNIISILRDHGPGTRDQGPGTRDQGQGTRDQGPGTQDQGWDQGPKSGAGTTLGPGARDQS